MTETPPGSPQDEADLPFRQVARDIPTPCWISDAEGSIIWVNDAWIAYTGMNVEAIRSRGLELLHDPTVYPLVRAKWASVKASGEAGEMTFPLRGRDGDLRPFRTRVVPLRDASGAITRWFGTNTDVSEQSRIEAELRESQQRLELATEAAELGIWDWNLSDNTFVYSSRARKICGFPADGEVTFEDVVRATHREDYPRTSAMAARALDPAIRSVERYRYRVVRPDGEVRIVEAQGRAVFESASEGAEKATRYVGTLRDLTDLEQVAEASRETEAILNSLFDASELYIAVVEVTEESFKYVLANRATLDFYNQPSDAAGFDARDIGIPDDEVKLWRATLLEVWNSGKARTMEYAFNGGKGAGWYVGTYTPLPPGPSGRPRLSFVVVDATERKSAEERQALLMREVDHRAKNALATAQAIVQLTRAETPEVFRKAVQGRIAALARVHTLLAEERWTGANLKRLVVEELEPYGASSSHIVIDGPSYALLPAVAQTFGLVIHELATNAAKHGALSRLGGSIEVRWRLQSNRELAMTWQERSEAIVPPDSRRGFGFTMLEQSIAKQLGGRWQVDWRADGVTITILLPGDGAERSAERPKPSRGSQLQALIVEDEPMIALALEDELRGLNIAVAAIAGRLSEAESVISAKRFDLAILDLNLGGESSVDIALRLREAGAEIIFCSGYQQPNLPPQLSSAPVLRKPLQPNDLAVLLRSRGMISSAK